MLLDPVEIAYRAPGIIIGLSFHEFAHAFAAHRFGDDTAKNHGRLTINPMAHLDVFGTIALFLVGLGWAKPVPVNPHNYRGNKKIADIIVSIAGPLTNLIISFLAVLLLGTLTKVGYGQDSIAYGLALYTAYINIVLFIFNLIPVPPLDGSHILFNLLPPGKRDIYFNLQKYGYVILLILIFTGAASFILNPLLNLILNGEFILANIFV